MDPYTPEELMEIYKKIVIDNEWKLKDEALSLEWFKKNSKQFSSYGRDMEQMFTYTKIAHSRRIYGKNEEKKNIDRLDIENGFKMFIDNRKDIKEDNIDTNILYSLYC
jgi:hypothetical protein